MGYPFRREFRLQIVTSFAISWGAEGVAEGLTGLSYGGTLPAPMLCQAVSVVTDAVPAPAVCGLGIELILILPL